MVFKHWCVQKSRVRLHATAVITCDQLNHTPQISHNMKIGTRGLAMKASLVVLISVAAVGINGACAPKNLTEEQKLDLVVINGNHDNNSLVTTSDMAYSILHHFDKNFDGEATPSELEEWWTCTYGDSVFFARYVFNENAQGRAALTPDVFAGPPYDPGLTVEVFRNHIQQYYRTFQSRGCVNTDLRFDQQLDLIVADNDFNKDGRVTGEDFRHDSAHNYDANGDGFVTFAEGVTAWTCKYGFPVGYGIYFAEEVIGREGYNISTEGYDPPFDAEGISVEEFRAMNLKRYLNYSHLELAKGECISSTATREEKIVVDAAANDFNKDLFVTSTDITFDLSENYDTDRNGRVTEDEWVSRWTCAYGDTVFYARYVFNRFTQGANTLGITDFRGVPPYDPGLSIVDFMSSDRQIYQDFENDGCLNIDLSLEQKLNLVVSLVDTDKNELISANELQHFFGSNYDVDNDGRVNNTEFLTRQGCVFGSSLQFSRFLWDKVNPQHNDTIEVSQVIQLLNGTDLPVAEYRKFISQVLYDFARGQVRSGGPCLPAYTPLEEKLLVNAAANDMDASGAVTASDVSSELSRYYDTNGDGIVTEEEWLTRRRCSLGETLYLSRYMFNTISNGEVQIGTSVNLYNRPPFIGAGIDLNSLNNLHREMISNFTSECVNNVLTLDQKLDIYASIADDDGNGFVTTADLANALRGYDANNDGNVSKAELVTKWTCRYADTVRFANFVWQAMSPSGNDIQIAVVGHEPPFNGTGRPIADQRKRHRERYLEYARIQLRSGGCSSNTLDMEDKLILDAVANDNDNNAVITKSDIMNDLRVNYDTNDDERVSEKEWVDRRTCAYGDTSFYASFMFPELTDGEFVDISRIPELNAPIDDFVSHNRQRYERFRKDKCINKPLSVEEKLDILISDNDFNKDGFVKTEDLDYDLNNRYDADGDGNVTVVEWRQRWTCAYGDTANYALFAWTKIIGPGLTVVPNSQFGASEIFARGMTVAAFRDRNRERYEEYQRQGGAIIGR